MLNNNKKSIFKIFPKLFSKNFPQKLFDLVAKSHSCQSEQQSFEIKTGKNDIKAKMQIYEKKRKERRVELQNIISTLTASIARAPLIQSRQAQKESDFHKNLYSTSDNEDESAEEEESSDDNAKKKVRFDDEDTTNSNEINFNESLPKDLIQESNSSRNKENILFKGEEETLKEIFIAQFEESASDKDEKIHKENLGDQNQGANNEQSNISSNFDDYFSKLLGEIGEKSKKKA